MSIQNFIAEHPECSEKVIKEAWELAQIELAKQLIKLPVSTALSTLEKLASK